MRPVALACPLACPLACTDAAAVEARSAARGASTAPPRDQPGLELAAPAPRADRTRVGPAGDPAQAGLAEFLAALDARGAGGAPLVLGDGAFERLFRHPEDMAVAEPCATRSLLDLLGDPRPEAVVAISGGWWSAWLHLCVFEREPSAWRLALHARVDGACRGLPTLAASSAGDRRWLCASWIDGWGTGVHGSSVALFEAVGARLELVLRAPSDGWLAGWGNPVDVEYGQSSFTLAREGESTTATLVLRITGTADAELAIDADVETESRLVFRQPARAAAFELVEPASSPRADAGLVVGLAEKAWLAQHLDLACGLAAGGTADQQRLLALLVDDIFAAGATPEARILAPLLPATARLADQRCEE